MTQGTEHRYRVITRSASRVRLPRDHRFELMQNDRRLLCQTEYETDHHGTAIPGWLRVEVECETLGPAEAQTISLQMSHQIACLLSLIGNAPVAVPKVQLLYEIRDDEDARIWQQSIHPDQARISSRLVDENDLKVLLGVIDKMEEETATKVGRALRWYRSGLSTDDLLERFTMVWSGLECLNRLLIDALGLPVNEKSKCPHCGEMIERPSAGGVHGWIEKTCGSDVRKEARDLRTQLAHGTGKFADAAARVSDVGQQVERALALAILTLANVELKPPEDPLGPDVPFLVKLTGTLRGPVEAALKDAPSHPYINGTLVVASSRNVGPDNGAVEFEYEFPGEKVVPDGVSLDVGAIEVPEESL